MSQATHTMESTSATSDFTTYKVVRLSHIEMEAQPAFKQDMREQFPFLIVGFGFTSEYTYIHCRYPYDAHTISVITGGDLVEREEEVPLVLEVFAGLEIDPALLHAHRACSLGCALCWAATEAEEEYRRAEEEYWRQENAYWRHRQQEEEDRRNTCDNCGSTTCRGRCEDEEDHYSDDDHVCGNRCRCCGYADDEVGTRYAGYCGYSCAQEDDY